MERLHHLEMSRVKASHFETCNKGTHDVHALISNLAQNGLRTFASLFLDLNRACRRLFYLGDFLGVLLRHFIIGGFGVAIMQDQTLHRFTVDLVELGQDHRIVHGLTL